MKPQFLDTMIFWRPGNLYWERRRASIAVARSIQINIVSGAQGERRRDGGRRTGITSANTKQNLPNVDTGDFAVWLAKGATHACLESICSGARQHLVDTDHMVWVGADAEVETFFTGDLDEVSVLY